MNKIIVPIDFSEYSEYALKAAVLLSKKTAVTIYALHMLDLQEVSLSQSAEYTQEKAVFFLKLAEKRFKEFLQKEYLKDVKIVPIVKHYTEKVIRYSDIPVMVLKNELKDIDFADIVFATDFSEESVDAFKKMLTSLDFLNVRKHLLYVNLPNDKFKTTPEMDALANKFLIKAEGNIDRLINVNFVCARSIEEGVLNFSNVIGADLITLITHGRKGLSHVFSGSISEDISNHSALPIMTFKM